MEPVACEQLWGCCAEACGAAGAALAALTVTEVAFDTQPALFFTVTLYVPGATLLNTLLCWY